MASMGSEWTSRWAAVDGDYEVIDGTSPQGGKYVEQQASTKARRALSWDEAGITTDTEVVALVRVPSFGDAKGYTRVYARGGTENGVERSYFAGINDTDGFVLRKHISTNPPTFLGEWGDPVADTWHWIRLRVEYLGTNDDNRVRGRSWQQGNAEPTAWDVDVNDTGSGVPNQGWVGIGGYSEDAQHWDWFGVGTGGAEAPLPEATPISVAPDGPAGATAVTPDADISSTAVSVSPDGPAGATAVTPDAVVTTDNVSVAPDGPAGATAVTPDADVTSESESEPVHGMAPHGAVVHGGSTDAVAVAPDGPAGATAVTPDADINAFINFQTALPDLAEITLDASVVDEITASYVDVLNNGSYRVQHKVASTSSWVDDGTVGHDTTSVTIGGLFDGERYDVRVRTETEHAEGTWVSATATTILPAPAVTTSVATDSVTLDIDDNADFEDGILVERRQQYSGGYGTWEELANLDPNSQVYTDANVVPGTTYQYRVTNYTDHTESPTTVTVTTTALDATYGTARVAPDGWTVTVVADDGTTRRPAVVGEPTYDPSLKSLPRVTLPVAQDDSWSATQWEDATLRVWRDGQRLPIEQLAGVEHQPGQTILRGLGGTELLEPQTHEFDATDVHAEVPTVVDQTSYAVVVDDPSADSSTLASPDTPSDLQAYYQDPADDSVPVLIDDDDGLRMAQSCYVTEAESEEATSTFVNDYPDGTPDWSGDEAVALPGDVTTWSYAFTPEYPIGDPFQLWARWNFLDFQGILEVFVDGTRVHYQDATGSPVSDSLAWSELNVGANDPPALDDSEHLIEISVSSVQQGDVWVDCVAPFDSDHHTGSTFPESTGSAHLPGPALFPASQAPRLLHDGFQSATGATVTLDDYTADGDGVGLRLSNDGGSTWDGSCTDCTSLSADFASPGPDILLEVTLERYGDRSDDIPETGYLTESVTGYTVDVDTRNSPPLQDDVYRTEGRQILTALAEKGIGLWAVTWDPVDGITVEFTNAGQRTAAQTLDLVDYSWSKETLERQVTWAVIRGAAQPVTGESFTGDVGGSDLAQGNLIPAREQVFTPDRATQFTRGTDYTVNYEVGTITVESGGNMTDGEDYLVDYEWKPEGEWSRGSPNPKKKIERTFVGATTDQLCRSIAYYLTAPERLGEPVRTGTAVIDAVPPGVSVLDALALDPVPETDRYHVRGVEQRAGEVRLDIATRRAIEDVVGDIRSRLEQSEERV